MKYQKASEVIYKVINQDDEECEFLKMLLPEYLKRFDENDLDDVCIDIHLLVKNQKICDELTKPFLILKLLKCHSIFGSKFKYNVFEAYFEQSPDIIERIRNIDYDFIFDVDSESFNETKKLLQQVDRELFMFLNIDETNIAN